MQRRIATWLLFIFLFANSELHELVKVGAFVFHYQEHLAESPGLSGVVQKGVFQNGGKMSGRNRFVVAKTHPSSRSWQQR
jgi:hypothetical protein